MAQARNGSAMGVKPLARTAYWKWAAEQGIPIIEGFGIEDVFDVPLAPWSRIGGNAAFIHLYGMQGVTGIYVAEIPPGEALKPERHMYEEEICILQGRGATEVWGPDGQKQWFEWGPWSVFAPPLNAAHQLINGSNEPVRFLAFTNAPMIFDIYRAPDFVFGCDFSFPVRFDGRERFFAEQDKRYHIGQSNVWETNLITDARTAAVDEKEQKGEGARITQYEMSGNSLIGHVAEWPVGRYQKAHYHAPGAVLLVLQSEGYMLMWPKEAGVHPFENGRGDDVVEVRWKPGGIFTPPGAWFHQHFNTGPASARMLAMRYGSRLYPIGFHVAAKASEEGHYTSIREGGTMIEYDDEDPEIRQRFEAELRAKGVESLMPPARYRTDPVR